MSAGGDRNGCPIDPECLQRVDARAGNLPWRRLAGEDICIAGDDPGFGVLRHLEILIRARIFDSPIVAVIDDEAELAHGAAGRRVDGNVEVDAEAVSTGLRDLARAPTVAHGGGIPRVEPPA